MRRLRGRRRLRLRGRAGPDALQEELPRTSAAASSASSTCWSASPASCPSSSSARSPTHRRRTVVLGIVAVLGLRRPASASVFVGAAARSASAVPSHLEPTDPITVTTQPLAASRSAPPVRARTASRRRRGAGQRDDADVAVVFTGGTITMRADPRPAPRCPALDGAAILARTPGWPPSPTSSRSTGASCRPPTCRSPRSWTSRASCGPRSARRTSPARSWSRAPT